MGVEEEAANEEPEHPVLDEGGEGAGGVGVESACAVEGERAVRGPGEEAVEDDEVQVEVGVQGGPEAMEERDAAEGCVGRSIWGRVAEGSANDADEDGGFNLFRAKVLRSIDFRRIQSNGYSFQIELKLRAWRNGFELREIPIIFVERESGESKMSKKIVREAVWKVWKLRFMDLFGRL